MIMFPMLILIVVPLVAGIESLFVKKENVRGISALAGICIGAFVWNAYIYGVIFPVVSIVLLILAVIPTTRLFRTGAEALKKGVIVAVVSTVVLFVAWQGILISLVNVETVSDVETLNPGGTAGTALVVYHPGKSGFPERVNRAFADGLVANGWRVDITTASSQAPTDLSGYDLLVLGSPTYDWKPSKRIQRYLEGLGDLGGQPTVVIISAAGTTILSLPTMENLVREANGELVASYAVWTIAPNQFVYGTSDPMEAMKQKAQAIPLPGE
jgi:hypothetical protein